MGRKKRPETAIPPGSNMIRLELSDEDHAALRVVAAKAGMSMAAYVRSLVSRHVRKEIEKPDER